MDNIERVNVHDEKYTDFGQRYQKGSIPVLISGAMSRWPAIEHWKLETFAEDFGHQKIICDHRFGIRMRFDDFRNYMEHQARKWSANTCPACKHHVKHGDYLRHISVGERH